jgi:hypothetical protein
MDCSTSGITWPGIVALTAKHIVFYEVAEHPSKNQLIALEQKHFDKVDAVFLGF